MAAGTRRHLALTATVAALLLTSACNSKPPVTKATDRVLRGGTLSVLMDTQVEHWDPQRMYGGPESHFAVRTFLRTLTTQGPAGVGYLPGLVGDLATSTGTETDGGKTWTFTLVDDAKWQDGRLVTCEDVRYGVSRNFARDQIAGGPPYAVALLDIPRVKDPSGADVAAYAGPYTGVGQELFDKAVACAGQDITFHLRAPVHDFNQTVSLPSFAPVRKDQDKGDASNLSVFSCGPYMLEGVWEPGNGGRFVRNRSWLPMEDPIRFAFPEVIDVREGIETTKAIQRIIDDKGQDRYAVTYASAPAAVQAQLLASKQLMARVTNPDGPTVEYLVPNFKSPVMSNPAIRQAFAMSTNRDAFSAAYGGPTAMTPTYSVMARNLPGRKDFNPFGVPTSGNAAAARDVLTRAGVPLPVPVRLAYRKSDAADKAFAGLKATWDSAGFAVRLEPIAENYYRVISSPAAAAEYDVFRASWSADWPSGSTVIPNNFDGRVNLTEAGPGQDYGYFNDPAVNKAIDEAYGLVNDMARSARWGDIDEMIAKAGGHIALGQERFMFVHGSGVVGYQDNLMMGGQVDLATVQTPK
jgi:peptide/nickel transport system substrate-binding protein